MERAEPAGEGRAEVGLQLDSGRITELLTELGARLHARGIAATIYVVGGAAMALSLDSRRATRDIDALYDDAAIRTEAARMAAELDLPEQWLSDAARAYVPPGGDESAATFEVPGLAVTISSPEHLFAMKMVAFRPQDQRDLDVLARALALRDAREVTELVERVYGEYLTALDDVDDLALRAASVIARLAPGSREDQPRRRSRS